MIILCDLFKIGWFFSGRNYSVNSKSVLFALLGMFPLLYEGIKVNLYSVYNIRSVSIIFIVLLLYIHKAIKELEFLFIE